MPTWTIERNLDQSIMIFGYGGNYRSCRKYLLLLIKGIWIPSVGTKVSQMQTATTGAFILSHLIKKTRKTSIGNKTLELKDVIDFFPQC